MLGLQVKNLTQSTWIIKTLTAHSVTLEKSLIDKQACSKAGLKGDIIVGIETKDSKGNILKYKVDSFAQVQFESTDMKVRFDIRIYALSGEYGALFRRKNISDVYI